MPDDKRVSELLDAFEDDIEDYLEMKVTKLRNEILGRETDEDSEVHLHSSDTDEDDEE